MTKDTCIFILIKSMTVAIQHALCLSHDLGVTMVCSVQDSAAKVQQPLETRAAS